MPRVRSLEHALVAWFLAPLSSGLGQNYPLSTRISPFLFLRCIIRLRHGFHRGANFESPPPQFSFPFRQFKVPNLFTVFLVLVLFLGGDFHLI